METQVTLNEILDARERRSHTQQALLKEYKSTLLCFTMNIAGPVKNNDLILRGFRIGNISIKKRLAAAGISILYYEDSVAATGNEAFYILDGDPMAIKTITSDIEDSSGLGRLFDMDVLRSDGSKIDRTELGLPVRGCLICGKASRECARSRAHTAWELYERTMQILSEAYDNYASGTISALASRALLYEVCTTPKPGLVDRANTGSHRDMDIFTFVDSTCALKDYFGECVRIGIRTAASTARETFISLRKAGIRAEAEMLHATHGINTHKGAIFSVGIVCGALGRIPCEKWTFPDIILDECAAIASGIVDMDLARPGDKDCTMALTTGQWLYRDYGITGIRGQMEAGLPAVRDFGLPVLKKGIASGLSINDSGCAALLAIMANMTDTNIIARSDISTQQKTALYIRELLSRTPYPDRDCLDRLDRTFIDKNLSPGGSADLLAISYLLYFLESEA